MENIFNLILILFFWSCNHNSKDFENKLAEDFKLRREMNFTTLNDFEWKELLILTPYVQN